MKVKHLQLFFYIILVTHFFNMGLSKPLSAEAGHLNAPVHNISMEFNLQSNSLRANSRIELPAGINLHLNVSNLNVIQTTLNGQPLELPEGNTFIEIPSSPNEQEILLSYDKEIPPGSSPAINRRPPTSGSSSSPSSSGPSSSASRTTPSTLPSVFSTSASTR